MYNRLPKPLRKQREVLYLPVTGHSAVLGTAGSGKTTLALYRAAFLSAPEMPHSGKTLLLTFNKALVTYLKQFRSLELQHVQVETYHSFARGYLNSRNKMGNNSICGMPKKEQLIEKSVLNIAKKYKKHEFFDRPKGFFINEIKWIQSHGITLNEDYINGDPDNREGTNLAKELRPVMFEIVEEYLKVRREQRKEYDWDDIAYHVGQELMQDTSIRHYRHIIVDEGQDFSPQMLLSLSYAIPGDGSLTFFGDVAQQIYGQRTSWRSAGLDVPQLWEFKENYRNTIQIARLGLAISRMDYFSGIADMVEPTFQKADGPWPTIVKCTDKSRQIDAAVKYAEESAKTKSVAVLFKNRDQERLVSKHFSTAIQLDRKMPFWQSGPGLFHGTYHSAKGLEFDRVILPFLDAENMPDTEHARSFGEKDALTYDGRLLYVAVTRARKELVLLHSSQITSLLPDDQSLYREVTL